MKVEFLAPEYFVLLIPFLIVVAYLGFKKWESTRSKYFLFKSLFQATIIIILIAALAQPAVQVKDLTNSSAVVIDCSDSIDRETLTQKIAEFRRDVPQDTLIQVMPFAKNAFDVVEVRVSELSTELCSRVKDLNATNLQVALEKALALNASQVLLFTDGNQTAGRVQDLFLQPRFADTPIYPFVVPIKKNSENRIEAFTVPQASKMNQEIETEFFIQNSNSMQRLRYKIYQNDQLIIDRSLATDSRQITWKSKPVTDELVQFRLELIDAVTKRVIDTRSAFTAATRSNKMLILSGDAREAQVLEKILQGLGKVYDSYNAGNIQDKKINLNDYSFVILNNISKTKLPKQFDDGLESFVSSGGKMLMVGGNQSFGLGAYQNSKIEELLPVVLLDPEKELKRVNVAVMLVLDKSGSMKEENRIEYTKLAAAGVVDVLQDEDYIGIVGFDQKPFVALPLSKVEEVRSKAKDRAQLLFPRGNTQLLPALDVANTELGRVSAGRKHIIVLTDGRLPDEYQLREIYLQLVRRMGALGVTLSTFLIGSDYSGLLREMAQLGGGSFYQSAGADALPRLFLQDIKVAIGERTQKENTRFTVDTGAAAGEFSKLGAYPDLFGFIATKIKPGAQMHLTIFDTKETAPLLASQKIGKGLVYAFTSDASGRWNRMWVNWTKLYDFWSMVLSGRTASGEGYGDENDFYLIPIRSGDSIDLELNIFSEKLAESFFAKIVTPDLKSRNLNFEQISKGRFKTTISPAASGSYAFSLLNSNNMEVGSRVFASSTVEVAERSFDSANVALLEEITLKSSGKLNPTKNDLQLQSQSKHVLKNLQGHFALILALLLLIYRSFVNRFRLF